MDALEYLEFEILINEQNEINYQDYYLYAYAYVYVYVCDDHDYAHDDAYLYYDVYDCDDYGYDNVHYLS